MSEKDLDLLEKLFENFCAKSEYCKNCRYKRVRDENRHYCYFGIICIAKQLGLSLDGFDK